MELPSQGESFQRKYKIHEVLGKGGFAAVYRATDVEIGRDVAIKVLAPSDDGYSKGIESRFMREARVIASLQDPHTITMFEFGRAESGLLFMVFEYVRGTDLSLLIRRNPLSESATIHVLKQVLQSLREAHAANVLHRDLKPANILIYEYMDDEFRAKLLDFGIAKPTAGSEDGLNITSDGAMIGTPRYMAPEQIYAATLTPASDIYSLGLVAYEMLVGQPAISGRTTKEMMVQQLSDTPVQLPPDLLVSPALRNVINRMTARDPANRFASADQAIQALQFVESSTSGPIPPPSGPNPSWSGPGQAPGPPANYPSQRHHPTGPVYPPQHNYPSQSGQQSPYGPQGGPPGASGVHRSWTERSIQAPSTQREIPRPEPRNSNWALAAAGLAVGAGIVSVLMFASYAMRETPAPVVVQQPPPRPQPAPQPIDTPPPPAAPDVGVIEDTAVAEIVGCGLKAGWEGTREFVIPTNNGRRKFTVYLPPDYDENREHSVMMLFHKAFNDSRWMLKDSEAKIAAEKNKFIVVAFDASDKTQPWDEYDIQLVELALDEIQKAACVDRGRVFAVGHGAGGDFVRVLACTLPIAGIGTVGSGEVRGARVCKPSPPVPYIRMAGLDDRYLPVAGGSSCLGGNQKSLEEIETDWRAFNACGDKRTRYVKKRGDVCWTWDCSAQFVSCHVAGGHDWPNSTPEKFEMPGCPSPPPTFPMMATMGDFFAAQPAVDWQARRVKAP